MIIVPSTSGCSTEVAEFVVSGREAVEALSDLIYASCAFKEAYIQDITVSVYDCIPNRVSWLPFHAGQVYSLKGPSAQIHL